MACLRLLWSESCFAEEEFVSPFLEFWCSVETLGSISTYPKGSCSFYPRTYNVCTPLAISVATVTLNLILVYKVLYSPSEPQVKFRQEGWAFPQPTAFTAWISLTVISNVFVSLCGKLYFMHFEEKTASRFHVNTYLGEILGRSTAPWFISHSSVIIKSSSLVLKPWWLKGHLSQM